MLYLDTEQLYGSTKVLDIKIDNSNIGLAPEPTLKEMKEWFAHIVLEYRYEKPEGGLMAKAGISPLFFDYMEPFCFYQKYECAVFH